MCIKKIFKRIDHPHIIECDDIAVGTEQDNGTPVTAFSYRCVLCGRKYRDVTELGIQQIRSGISEEKVFQWMNECVKSQ